MSSIPLAIATNHRVCMGGFERAPDDFSIVGATPPPADSSVALGADCRCSVDDVSGGMAVVDLATPEVDIEDLFESDDDDDDNLDVGEIGEKEGKKAAEEGEDEAEAGITARIYERLHSMYTSIPSIVRVCTCEEKRVQECLVHARHGDSLNNADAYPRTLYVMRARQQFQ
jgi:hypothetical protein